MKTLGAALASRRERQTKHCNQCGNLFLGLKISRYCSEACRQRAKYHRSKQVMRQTPLSRTLGLSRAYDWSNKQIPEEVFLLRVLQGVELIDIAKCVRVYGADCMQIILDRIDDPLTRNIAGRKLRNAIEAIEHIDAAA
ncbi:hypothetical protein SAMN05216526_1794 [Ectothiorhodosinus mongolicus]|uniref:Uncharacterized protein n=1 Tax=Ectothiorhodosinus mongolicus TaxID=233100 RepID=A0A1R3W782_9GAMM|nr:hypothetical protein [Ectothiorhodosinus mongolicus]ULX57601.1 hypothetical protein CKX93_07995 [Ectothiorhodosinus mongolicus]SIT73047.1 hypothetical protein SAMN05216526_1794 [Ectothiorhodosinus mongolicus]